MKRREFIALVGGAAASVPLAARAQQSAKVYRLGFIGNDPAILTDTPGKAFVDGLRANELIVGNNVAIEWRFAEGNNDRYAPMAEELVRLGVDVIVTTGTPPSVAASRATKVIPIVMVFATDPVAIGIAGSLARPGGNVTGLSSDASADISGKRLQLLKEAVPQILRVAVLMNADLATDRSQLDVLKDVAPSLGLSLDPASLRGGNDIRGVLSLMARPDTMLILSNGLNLPTGSQ